jgi:hypothetical protein
MKRFVFLALGFLGAMGWAVPAMAQTTVKFQQGTNGYSGAMDTYIDKFMPTDFFGGVERVEIRDWSSGTAEKMNVLISFDVSSLPSNATVTSAKLTMYNIRARGHSANDTVILEKVTSAWNNQSTWSMGVPTAVASGVTCPTVAGYTEDPATPPPASEAYVITGLAALVTGWRASPQTNYGIMLSCTTDLNFRFASSEYATVAVRPALEVTYTTPNMTPPPTVTVTSAPSATTTSPITVSGTASATSPATVTQITWLNTLTGASGTASGTTSWTASIPLGRGVNAITVTVTDSNAGTASTSFSVDYTPPAKAAPGNKKICGLGAAGDFTGSSAVVALGLLLLIGVATRRTA